MPLRDGFDRAIVDEKPVIKNIHYFAEGRTDFSFDIIRRQARQAIESGREYLAVDDFTGTLEF